MAKQTRELKLWRGCGIYCLEYKNGARICEVRTDPFRKLCPNLAEGMDIGQSKKLKLTQLAKGIKLERID